MPENHFGRRGCFPDISCIPCGPLSPLQQPSVPVDPWAAKVATVGVVPAVQKPQNPLFLNTNLPPPAVPLCGLGSSHLVPAGGLMTPYDGDVGMTQWSTPSLPPSVNEDGRHSACCTPASWHHLSEDGPDSPRSRDDCDVKNGGQGEQLTDRFGFDLRFATANAYDRRPDVLTDLENKVPFVESSDDIDGAASGGLIAEAQRNNLVLVDEATLQERISNLVNSMVDSKVESVMRHILLQDAAAQVPPRIDTSQPPPLVTTDMTTALSALPPTDRPTALSSLPPTDRTTARFCLPLHGGKTAANNDFAAGPPLETTLPVATVALSTEGPKLADVRSMLPNTTELTESLRTSIGKMALKSVRMDSPCDGVATTTINYSVHGAECGKTVNAAINTNSFTYPPAPRPRPLRFTAPPPVLSNEVNNCNNDIDPATIPILGPATLVPAFLPPVMPSDVSALIPLVKPPDNPLPDFSSCIPVTIPPPPVPDSLARFPPPRTAITAAAINANGSCSAGWTAAHQSNPFVVGAKSEAATIPISSSSRPPQLTTKSSVRGPSRKLPSALAPEFIPGQPFPAPTVAPLDLTIRDFAIASNTINGQADGLGGGPGNSQSELSSYGMYEHCGSTTFVTAQPMISPGLLDLPELDLATGVLSPQSSVGGVCAYDFRSGLLVGEQPASSGSDAQGGSESRKGYGLGVREDCPRTLSSSVFSPGSTFSPWNHRAGVSELIEEMREASSGAALKTETVPNIGFRSIEVKSAGTGGGTSHQSRRSTSRELSCDATPIDSAVSSMTSPERQEAPSNGNGCKTASFSHVTLSSAALPIHVPRRDTALPLTGNHRSQLKDMQRIVGGACSPDTKNASVCGVRDNSPRSADLTSDGSESIFGCSAEDGSSPPFGPTGARTPDPPSPAMRALREFCFRSAYENAARVSAEIASGEWDAKTTKVPASEAIAKNGATTANDCPELVAMDDSTNSTWTVADFEPQPHRAPFVPSQSSRGDQVPPSAARLPRRSYVWDNFGEPAEGTQWVVPRVGYLGAQPSFQTKGSAPGFVNQVKSSAPFSTGLGGSLRRSVQPSSGNSSVKLPGDNEAAARRYPPTWCKSVRVPKAASNGTHAAAEKQKWA